MESERVMEEHRGKENSARGFSLVSIIVASAMIGVGHLHWWEGLSIILSLILILILLLLLVVVIILLFLLFRLFVILLLVFLLFLILLLNTIPL